MAKKRRGKKEPPYKPKFRAQGGMRANYQQHLTEMREYLHSARHWEALAREPDETDFWFRIVSGQESLRQMLREIRHAEELKQVEAEPDEVEFYALRLSGEEAVRKYLREERHAEELEQEIPEKLLRLYTLLATANRGTAEHHREQARQARLALRHDYVTLECQGRLWNNAKCGYRHPVKLKCGNRCCEQCANDKARNKLYREYCKLLRQVPPGHLFHVVLTLADTDDLEAAMAQILDGFQRLRRWKRYQTWQSGFRVLASPRHVEPDAELILDEAGNPDGMRVVDIDHGWHVHLHLILEVDGVDEIRLRQDWVKATGNPESTVQVTQLRRKQIDQTLHDVLTHVRRGPELPDEHIEEFNLAMYGKRVFQAFGDWYNVVTMTGDRPSRFLCPLCLGYDWKFIWEDEALASFGSDDASAHPS